ncbi:unnamed protein product [Dicrocoelium dendriticum]|nr:unnamed protein product [Dicrocoelium dendriticum]
MFLLLIDAHSKWIDVHPVTQATAESTITKMRSSFATFGIPETICTDNGSPFTSAEFGKFVANNGIQHVKSAPYHPASNGLAERAVQTVKHGLLKQRTGTLRTKLDRFLFSYRSTPTEATGKSPAELMFGRNLRTRLHLLFPNPRVEVQERQKKFVSSEESKPEVTFQDHQPVYTRLPHEQCWQPATVLDSSGSQNDLQLPDGRVVRRHSDHVRPRSTDTPAVSQSHSEIAEQAAEHDEHRTTGETQLRRSTRIRKPIERFQP